MRYVALLRGINVGGNKKVEMKKLKVTFERLGYTDVATYINSGNVVFTATEQSAKLITKCIERQIADDFGFEVPTLVVSAESLQSIATAIPSDWANEDDWKTDVCFLWKEIDDKTIIEKLGYDETIEAMVYVPGVVIWHVSRTNQLKSKMMKVVGTKLYSLMTVRNVNTVRKLALLSQL